MQSKSKSLVLGETQVVCLFFFALKILGNTSDIQSGKFYFDSIKPVRDYMQAFLCFSGCETVKLG